MRRDNQPCRKLASSFPSITDFEVCALANLAPGDAEEAKLMVPSLAVWHLRTCLRSLWVLWLVLHMCTSGAQGKLSDDDLNQVAEEIATYR